MKDAALQRSVARDSGGVSQIKVAFSFFSFLFGVGKGGGGGGKTLERNIMAYHKKVSHYTTFTLMIA